MRAVVQMRAAHVKAGKPVVIPKGFSIHHSTLIEPKQGKPYFTVLLTDEKKSPTDQLPQAIGYHVSE